MPEPNVLFVLADDLGWGDIGCHGSDIDTPTIDRVMDQGLELREHYVCPMCTPSRVSLMTGRYPSRFGTHATTPSNEPVLPDGYETLATHLSDAGYDTGLFGKWHLGSDPEYGPNEYGFDYAYGSLAGGVDPYNHRYKPGPYTETWHRNGELVDERGHVTDLIADEAAEWIAGRDQPWFCYVPFTAVHTPHKPTEQWANEYENEQFYGDERFDRGHKQYAGYTSHMDSAFAQLIEEIKMNGQLDNTIIVFASDNGAVEEPSNSSLIYPGWQWETPGLGNNHPFKGQKAELYEGGIRTPAAVMWPGEIESGTLDQTLGIVDWLPTMANLVGFSSDRSSQWDGLDVWPQLTDEVEEPTDRSLYWNFRDERFAMRNGDWKLITDETGNRLELYNVADHPYEGAVWDGSDKEAVVQDLLDELEDERSSDGQSKRADA